MTAPTSTTGDACKGKSLHTTYTLSITTPDGHTITETRYAFAKEAPPLNRKARRAQGR